MHVLVTGGAGFIGSHLAGHHLAKGDRVHVIDNLLTGAKSNIAPFLDHPDFRYSEHDIVTWKELGKAAAWADRIYHLAAVVGVFKVLQDPIAVMTTNLTGCERLLQAVAAGRWRPHVVIASSSEVYGPTEEDPLREEAKLVMHSGAQLRWNYAISKLADEAFGISYYRKFGIPITIVRLFNTVGPRQTGRYGMVMPRFIGQAVTGDDVTIYGDGTQSRSFCDVRDTVEALDMLASIPASAGEIINVGNDREISIRDLAELIIQRSGSSSRLVYMDYKDAYGEDFEEIPHRRPCLEKLARLTGFTPKWSLEQTIDDLLARAGDTHDVKRNDGDRAVLRN